MPVDESAKLARDDAILAEAAWMLAEADRMLAYEVPVFLEAIFT